MEIETAEMNTQENKLVKDYTEFVNILSATDATRLPYQTTNSEPSPDYYNSRKHLKNFFLEYPLDMLNWIQVGRVKQPICNNLNIMTNKPPLNLLCSINRCIILHKTIT